MNGSLAAGATTVTVTSVTGLSTSGGVLVIDREDSSGNATPTKREYISFTGIAGNDLTGVTRGVGGSTDQAHSSGALIEENWSVTHWGDAVSFLQAEHNTTGLHVISTATITTAVIGTRLNASAASNTFGDILVSRHAFFSGASISGSFPIHPTWLIARSSSAATTGIGTSITMPQSGSFQWVTVTAARGMAPSAASLLIDINLNNSSIFEANTRPFILGGGSFYSSASINTKLFSAGNAVNVDIDSTTQSTLDFSVLLRGN